MPMCIELSPSCIPCVQGALESCIPYSTLFRLCGVIVVWFLQPQQHWLQPYDDSTTIVTGNNDLCLLPISFVSYIFGHGGWPWWVLFIFTNYPTREVQECTVLSTLYYLKAMPQKHLPGAEKETRNNSCKVNVDRCTTHRAADSVFGPQWENLRKQRTQSHKQDGLSVRQSCLNINSRDE
jgi:hypothetical protein